MRIRNSCGSSLVPHWYFGAVYRESIAVAVHHLLEDLLPRFFLSLVSHVRPERDSRDRTFTEAEFDIRYNESDVGPVLYGGFVLEFAENVYEQEDLLLVLEAFELEHRL